MRQLYLDCSMGAAGDMLAAALYELLGDEQKKTFLDTMSEMMPDGVEVSVTPSVKCGIKGTHFDVAINGETEKSEDHHHDHDHDHHHDHSHSHSHRKMSDIAALIDGFAGVGDDVKASIKEVYSLIADAESKVHGVDVTEIHFHEVGTLDAVADVSAACLLMDMIRPDSVIASPVRTGKGKVHCAHGILPVPAPATAELLTGIPTYAGNIDAELCTPTGAALLRHFVNEFDAQPVMAVNRIGYGMGTKDFDECNCLRALLTE